MSSRTVSLRPLAVLAASAMLLSAAVTAAPARAAAARGRLDVVASFYPLVYAAERVGADRVRVSNLTPPGAEPHDLELTPKQVDQLLDADLVVDLGRDFQPAVGKAAASRDGPTLRVLDTLPIAERAKRDPHVWLDPALMTRIVTQVQRALVKADPKGRDSYRRNGERVRAELHALDQRFERGLADCDRTLIVTAHESFGHLARRYGLRQEGVVGLSPDAEPDPKRLADLTDLVEREGVMVVFSEELASPRVAETLAREAGVRTRVLNPLEGLSRSERRVGADYVSVMDENLAELREALGCR